MNPNKTIEQTKETYRAGLPKADPEWPRRVWQALAFINLHLFDQRLTVSWMKEQCRLNGHNFSSRFAYYIGQTPKHYILHHRIVIAKALLSENELKGISVSTIAYELGFSGPSAFSKAFKQITGATPLRWQRKT